MSRLSPLRPFFLLAPLGLLYLVIAGRFIQLHAYEVPLSDEYAHRLTGEKVILANRGSILDRNGVHLAYDRPSFQLEMGYIWRDRRYNPANWELHDLTEDQIAVEVAHVARVARLDAEELEVELRNPDAKMTPIAWDIDPFHADRIQGLLNEYTGFGLVLKETRTREYPLGRAASHVVGLYQTYWEDVETDQLDEHGAPIMEQRLKRAASGIEHAFMDALTGLDGRKESLRIRYGINPSKALVEAIPGGNVQLTLDARIQECVRMELARAMTEFDAEAAAAIVLDPKTGEILAMHSVPDFDPEYPVADDEGFGPDGERVSLHLKLTDGFEPGSTFKPFVVAAALDLGAIRPEEMFQDPGHWYFGRRLLNNASSVPNGSKTAADCILHSSNVVAAQIATRIGVERFRSLMDRLGVWDPVSLPGMRLVTSSSPPEKEWQGRAGAHYTVPTMSFGQGFYANPVRLAGMLCAFANEGVPVEPHLIEGQGRELEPLFSPRSAAYASEAMEAMMDRQVDRNRFLPDPGVRAAAKSGTAQHPSNKDLNTLLFTTFAPVEDPEVLVLTMVYNPAPNAKRFPRGPSGTKVAGPVATRILKHALRIRGEVPRVDPRSLDSGSETDTLEQPRKPR